MNGMVERPTAGCQQLAIRRVRKARDRPCMPQELAPLLARRRVPEVDHVVTTARSQRLAVGREGNAPLLRLRQLQALRSRGRVPEPNGTRGWRGTLDRG